MQANKTRLITYCAVLIAIAVVAKSFLGIPVTFAGVYAKSISIAPVVVMLAGIIAGPLYGGIVGAITDVICFVINPMGAYFPGYTLTMALYGIIPGFMIKDKITFVRVLITAVVTQIICSALLNTYWMNMVTGLTWEVLSVRLIGCFVSVPVYVAALYILTKLQKKVAKQPLREFRKA